MADQLQTARRHTDNSRECSCSFMTQLSTLNFSTTQPSPRIRRAFRFGRDEISEIELWNRMRAGRSTHFRLLRDANVLWFSEEFRLREGYGATGSALREVAYFAIQTFLASVKKFSASVPPSQPTPLCFMPPKGTRRSRMSQQFTQTVPVLIRSATRWARLRFCVQTLDERPYSTSLA